MVSSIKYQIKITYPSGTIAFMFHRDKTKWCLKTAKKYLREWVYLHGINAELVEA